MKQTDEEQQLQIRRNKEPALNKERNHDDDDDKHAQHAAKGSNRGANNRQPAMVNGGQRDRFRKLVDACKRKELDKIKQMLSEHPELLNYHDKHHRNLLHYVSIRIQVDDPLTLRGDNRKLGDACVGCFKYLVARCEPKLLFQVDQDGLTILHLAVISCNNPLVREILFDRQAAPAAAAETKTVSLVTTLDKEHHSPLHWAVITNNLDCVRLLIDHSGVQLVHQVDLNGATPLHYATQTSDYPKYRQQLKQMLKNATSANTTSSSLSSSTSTSSSSSSPEGSTNTTTCDSCTETTTQRAEAAVNAVQGSKQDGLNSESAKLEPPLPPSASGAGYNNLDILDFLAHLPGVNLECRDRDSRTPLLWAASSGNRQAILLLLQAGANYLCQDANNLGPLHCAASHGFTNCLECLLMLSSSSSSVSSQINQADNLNCTPLFYAVLSGNIDCVELLLDRGAKPDWQDVKGRTAAHFAALRGQLNTLKLLEARGANLWLANKQGDLPLHYAIKSGRQQVVAWLLERSPYERPVNAINNVGRAPIHLAILKGNAAMVEFLVDRGANLNQLVKVKDKAPPVDKATTNKPTTTNGEPLVQPAKSVSLPASYHYETALDMAQRLNQRECLELLERNSARSAASVMANRKQTDGGVNRLQQAGGGNPVHSLFDSKVADVASSPIGFETSGSSAEPPVESSGSKARSERIPKLPARPEAMAEPVPQSSDSANSSALSVSSVTSLRGLQRQQHQQAGGEVNADEREDVPLSRSSRQRPYRGGINYHNERINASIKCKLYENQATVGHHNHHHHSFPPLNGDDTVRRRASTRAKYHSAGSVSAADQQQSALKGAGRSPRSHSGGQQEIVTNVNVYTTSPCAQCCHGAAPTSDWPHQKCQSCSKEFATTTKRVSTRNGGAVGQVAAASRHHDMDGMISETSDSTDATSETVYEDSEREDFDQQAVTVNGGHGGGYLPALANGGSGGLAAATAYTDAQHVRYVPPSRSYTQHLPVILSAEEDRSTSGETIGNGSTTQHAAPAQRTGPVLVGVASDGRYDAAEFSPTTSPHSGAFEEPRFDRSQRGRAATNKRRQIQADRYQARSPVADYIHGRDSLQQQPRSVSEVRSGWVQQQQQQPIVRAPNYSQIRAKVDSHRNDSGLSSHFGDELDGGSSTAGRRSKSWSSTFSTPGNQREMLGDVQPQGGHEYGGLDGGGKHEEQDGLTAAGGPPNYTRQTTTVIKTRRLSVDTDELASSVEKSIRRYKQESKLFEELQNLKRSQIRSGRANEALLVKRLAEHFRQEALRDSLIGLEAYQGPYTYQAYELYLYDQLKRISQINYARLVGGRAPHKFTYQPHVVATTEQTAARVEPPETVVGEGEHDDENVVASLDEKSPSSLTGNTRDSQEVRDFIEEDLRAEQELQQVLNRGESELQDLKSSPEKSDTLEGTQEEVVADETISIEPSGALEDIRVRQRRVSPDQPVEAPPTLKHEGEDQLTDLKSGTVGDTDSVAERPKVEPDDASAAVAANGHDGDTAQRHELQGRDLASMEIQSEELEGSLEPIGEACQAGGLTEAEESELVTRERPATHVAASSSSTCSSRKSSVELEQEKLDKLPLKVQDRSSRDDEAEEEEEEEDDDERRQIELQAIDLTSAIITDALGNVSSTQGESAANTKRQSSEIKSAPSSVDETSPKVVDADADAQEESFRFQGEEPDGRGRRRSVVNIGDKIEIVYHKVGIEIDTVEENHSDEEEEAGLAEERAEDLTESSSKEQPEATRQQEDAEEDAKQVPASVAGVHGGPRRLSRDVSTQAEVDPQEEAPDSPRVVDEPPRGEESKTQRRKSSTTTGAAVTPAKPISTLRQMSDSSTVLRRASMPHAPMPKEVIVKKTGSRRSSSPFYPSTGDPFVERKIFNGFDLDSLREHRRRHLQQQQSLASDDKEQQLPSGVRPARKTRRTTRSSARPRRARSRIPPGPYTIYVPVELIRERWNEVKKYERARCKAMLKKEGESRTSLVEQSHSTIDRGTSSGLITTRDGISHAKSHQSFMDNENRPEIETKPAEYTNIVLVYELNKPLVDNTASGKSREEAASQNKGRLKWCQKRMMRIVDVRTLKRTLSLPESLIYSNELMKRFNILKL